MKKHITILSFFILPIFLFLYSCEGDPCDSRICLNGGVCETGTCKCADGYSGDKCQNYDPCHDVTCLNNGVCESGSCKCPEGYSGRNCEIFDACYNKVCINGGQCVDGTCECPRGYTGVDCGEIIVPKGMIVSKIDILKYPNRKPNRDTWDALNGPDIIVTFTRGTSTKTADKISDKFTNATGNAFSVRLDNSIDVDDLLGEITIGAFDDDHRNNYEFMADVQFNPIDYSEGLFGSFEVQDDDLKLRIYVDWYF